MDHNKTESSHKHPFHTVVCSSGTDSYIEDKPEWRLGSIKALTMEGKIDSYEGISLASVSPAERQALIEKILETLTQIGRVPLNYTVENDGVLVKWLLFDELDGLDIIDVGF